MARIPEPAELYEDLREISERLARMEEKLDAKYVPREVYEARHTALRSEVALELANIRATQDSDRKTAHSAKQLAQWCMGMIATAVIVAMVGFLVQGGAG